MRCGKPHYRLSLIAALAIMASSGCSQFANIRSHSVKIPMWKPVSAQIEGVETVAVLPFEGEWGVRVSEEVADSFSESGTYKIVSASSLPAVTSSSMNDESPSLEEALTAARQADIDAVLTGTIVSEESEECPRSRFLRISRSEDQAKRTMTVDYRLIDTRTGETLCRNRISCLETEPEASKIAAVEQNLIQRCGHEVASQLTPQCGDCSIALANGHWTNRGVFAVRKGVRAAEAGNWDDATKSWEAVLKVNPNNDAAIFNLALASASRGDYETAEDLALQAIRLQHCDCYEKGLERIRDQRTQFELAEEQRNGIKLSSLESQTR